MSALDLGADMPAQMSPVDRKIKSNDLDVITIIESRQPAAVGKRFDFGPDGKITKQQVANITSGVAFSCDASTAQSMRDHLGTVAAKNYAVVCTALWNGDDQYDAAGDILPFEIVTEPELARLTGLFLGSPELGGIHTFAGRRVAARLKRGLQATTWALFDADNPSGIPAELAAMGMQARLEYFESILPGLSKCERVELRSGSARVRRHDEAPKGPTHALVRVDDPAKIVSMKQHCCVQMVLQGKSFPSPRYSRHNPGTVIGYARRSVFDLAVLDPGRLVFCSPPTLSKAMVDDGYVVDDANVTIVNEGGGPLVISGIELPDDRMRARYTEVTGEHLAYDTSGMSLAVRSVGPLTLDTEIESRGEVRTFRDWLDIMGRQGIEHLRCEAPFRASSSEAAFVGRTGTERGFVHDVGNGTTYQLDETAIRDANIAKLAMHFQANPLPITTPMFGVTDATIASIPDAAVSERLAHDFRSLNLGPGVLPDHDQTRTGHPAQKQITTTPRVSYVMRALELKPTMNVYARQPIITSQRSPWYDPKNDDSDAIMGALGHACARCGMSSRGLIEDTAVEAAGRNMFNPVMDWVQSIPWDGRPRFPDFAATLEMADPARNRWRDIALRRWTIQAVTAWLNFNRGSAAKPAPYVPVLSGAQGIGKTKWVDALLPKGWVKTDMSLRLDHNERDAVTRVTANPIVELAEVDASFRKSDVASLKTFLSSNVDSHRPPYGRRLLSTPRCTAFVATVNLSGFLVDATGARRFWPLPVECCHFDHGIDLQQYWAEVLTWVEAGEQYWLTGDEAELHGRIVAEHAADTPVSELVIELVVARNKWPENGVNSRLWTWEGTTKLLQHAGIGHDPVRMQEFNERLLGAGFKRRKNDKKWRVPDLLACSTAVLSGMRPLTG